MDRPVLKFRLMLPEIDAQGVQFKARIAFIGQQTVVLVPMHLVGTRP